MHNKKLSLFAFILSLIAIITVWQLATHKETKKQATAPTKAEKKPATTPSGGVLNIANWANYIAPSVLTGFEKETGIKVVYDTYSDEETIFAKLLVGSSGYDLVIQGITFANQLEKANLLAPLDASKIPNLKNLDPAIMAKFKGMKNAKDYVVPYLWAYNTIIISKSRVQKALGNLPMPSNPWQLIFDPIYAKKLSHCGIAMPNSASIIVPSALLYLGYDADTEHEESYQKVSQMLASVRPYVQKLITSGASLDVATHNLCVAVSSPSEVLSARQVVGKADAQDIEAMPANRDAVLFIDTMFIPKGAKNSAAAYRFINYFLTDQANAAVSNVVHYPNATIPARRYIDSNLIQDAQIYPDKKTLGLIAPPVLLNSTIERLQVKTFSVMRGGSWKYGD